LLPWLVVAPIFLRETGGGRPLLEHALEEARARSALGALPFVLNLIARDPATTDRPAVAEATYREAIELARESGQRTERPPSSSARRRSNTTSATCTSSSGSTLARNLSRRSLPVRSRRLGAQCPPSGSHNAPA
jgi:hypothetical protein